MKTGKEKKTIAERPNVTKKGMKRAEMQHGISPKNPKTQRERGAKSNLRKEPPRPEDPGVL